MLFGLATFAIPQFVFRRYLLRSYDELCTIALYRFFGIVGWEVRNEPTVLPGRTYAELVDEESQTRLADLVETSAPPRLWVYDSADFVTLFLGQLAGLAIILGQQVVVKLL